MCVDFIEFCCLTVLERSWNLEEIANKAVLAFINGRPNFLGKFF